MDFGLSKTMDAEPGGGQLTRIALTSQGAGTAFYRSPETFEAQARISSKVDVWSTGIIFFEVLYGKRPFGDNLSQEAILRQGGPFDAASGAPDGGPPACLVFPSSPKVSDETKNFISRLLSVDYQKRPDPRWILDHDHYWTKFAKE